MRREHLLRTFRELSNSFRNSNVLGQIEVVQTLGPCYFGDGNVAVIRQAGHNRARLVGPNVCGQRVFVTRVQIKSDNILIIVCVHDVSRYASLGVGQLHAIVARLGQQTRDQSPDLAGAQYENILH